MILHRITIVLLVSLSVCLWAEGALTKSGVRKVRVKKIIIDERAEKETLPAWLAYAGTRAEWMEAKYYQRHPKSTHYSYTFAEELEAFQNLVTVWKETKDGKRNAFLDSLIIVDQAGFLPQYVWTTFYDKEWNLDSAPKNVAAFRAWQQQNLRNHIPERRVELRVDR